MTKLHYIENFGTGIPRILETYEKTNKKVNFKVSDNFFIVEFPNLNYVDPVSGSVNDHTNYFINNTLKDIDLSILRTI